MKALYLSVLNWGILVYLISFIALPVVNYFLWQGSKAEAEKSQQHFIRARLAFNYGILLPQALALTGGYYLVFYG